MGKANAFNGLAADTKTNPHPGEALGSEWWVRGRAFADAPVDPIIRKFYDRATSAMVRVQVANRKFDYPPL